MKVIVIILCLLVVVLLAGCRGYYLKQKKLGSNETNELKSEIKYIVLPSDEFDRQRAKAQDWAPVKTDEEKNALRDNIGLLQTKVSDRLKKIWPDDGENWEVTYNFQYHYYTYGGIYSEEAFSKKVIDIIVSAIDEMEQPMIWAFLMSCEIVVDENAKTMGEAVEFRGEYLIKNRVVYIPESMQKKHRLQLGCDK